MYYKKMKAYAQSNGLSLDDAGKIAYGTINGVFVAIRQDPATAACHMVQLWLKPGDREPVPSIAQYVEQCRSKYKYLSSVGYDGRKVTAQFHGMGFKWGSEYVPAVESFIKDITAYASANQLIPCCEQCGEKGELALYAIDEVDHIFCDSCYAGISGNISRKTEEIKSAGNGNIAGGIIGAILGAMIGVVLWVLIYQLGYISALVGAAMVFCAFQGYKLLGGRLNLVGIIVCCVISILMLLVAEYITLGVEVYKVYSGYISIFEALGSVPGLLQESEVVAAVGQDLLFGYVLMALGAWGCVKNTYNENSGVVKNAKIANVTRN